jgi:hypothetical protein
MFCPGCGTEERGRGRFCRGCGSELQSVRLAMEKPDAITQSAVTARDEVGRAIAAKFKEIETGRDFRRVVEDALPAIEKFLESPEEKRLRHIREGVTTASVGVGLAIFAYFMSIAVPAAEKGSLFVLGAAGILFMIGLGLTMNGFLFSTPRKRLVDHHPKLALDPRPPLTSTTPSLSEYNPAPSSITEETTYNLQPIDKTTSPR